MSLVLASLVGQVMAEWMTEPFVMSVNSACVLNATDKKMILQKKCFMVRWISGFDITRPQQVAI
jgi:hypothetical protein